MELAQGRIQFCALLLAELNLRDSAARELVTNIHSRYVNLHYCINIL
jgi:hypothetical protein